MTISDLKNRDFAFLQLTNILDFLHFEGPIRGEMLETISYLKLFHPEMISKEEEKIISVLGLFYKLKGPSSLYSYLLSRFGNDHRMAYGESLTPVQASIRRAIEGNQFTSISAPTSAGKSFSVRDFIYHQRGDAVVIVPSRALIAEYMNTMKRKFAGNKTVMISPFVDNVFKKRELRKIFVLTPERARELFKKGIENNITTFFLDEAQVSEEKTRGVIFDVLVRRIKRNFPNAKIIFAHPFVDNPDAQIHKHGFPLENSFARSYAHAAVGKISIFQHSNRKFYYFSPFSEGGHRIKNCIEFNGRFDEFAFDGNHSVLVYVSKTSIYTGSFLTKFSRYIAKFPDVLDENATGIIENIKSLLGADEDDHKSHLVLLLRKGVVIHHGSVPLEVRFLIEDFIRLGFAKICFATSTLAQGVNMPFDIVWLENNRFLGGNDGAKSLAFKNLVGRSGRLSDEQKFDYGYVFTRNPRLFTRHITQDVTLSNESIIDQPLDEVNSDEGELIEALKNGDFDEETQMPRSKLERLADDKVLECCCAILNLLYGDGKTIKENLSGGENRSNRQAVIYNFKRIYEVAINRRLYNGEDAVFDQAIRILIYIIQGRSFREIIGLRYSYISRKDENHAGFAQFSQPAEKLPNSTLINVFSIFDADRKAKDVSYDAIVFDTYDYLDQVIAFSLSDTFAAAFNVYADISKDSRAEKMVELLKFGTNNADHILLMRYGFPPENVSEISEYVSCINEDNIVFKADIEHAPIHIRELVDWYLP